MKGCKKAFSLAEIIVAMAIIVMISGVGFLSCVIATRIRANATNDAKGFHDAELFRASMASAYEETGKNPDKRDEFVSRLWGKLEWYFEADGLYAAAQAHDAREGEWTVEVPILKDAEGEPTRSISVYYAGMHNENESYAYTITVTDAGYFTVCLLNCRTDEYGGTITSCLTKSQNPFYEGTFNL